MYKVKEYLGRLARYDLRIQRQQARVDRLRDAVLRVTPVMKDVPGGGSHQDRMADTIIRMVDMKAQIRQISSRRRTVEKEIVEMMGLLPNPKHRLVLYRRYVDRIPLAAIAEEMHYSYRGICKLHGRALQAMCKTLHDELGGDWT